MGPINDFPETEMFAIETAAPQPPSRPAGPEVLDIRFTGSGSEYFRIWIVNLLLTLVTLTLYLPFARARRMTYFQNNTLVGGDPLGFHADPWKMFRGYLLVLVLGISYTAISEFVPSLTWLALTVLAALWPALWRASLQFRLRNTSWRGVRLAFEGELKPAYQAMLPLFVPALTFALFLPHASEMEQVDRATIERAGLITGGVFLVFMLLLPWIWARIKIYQHGGYAFAQERTSLPLGPEAFYLLSLKVMGVSMLVMLGLATLIALGFGLLLVLGVASMSQLGGGGRTAGTLAIVGISALFFVMYVLWPLIVGSYLTARFQNLLWTNTRSPAIRFGSDLRMGPLLKLNIVNWLLILVTLGLYWPFAKVRAARIRLEAMHLEVDGDVNEWVSTAQQRPAGVLGDAAGDFFGIDMGL